MSVCDSVAYHLALMKLFSLVPHNLELSNTLHAISARTLDIHCQHFGRGLMFWLCGSIERMFWVATRPLKMDLSPCSPTEASCGLLHYAATILCF
jgi:hypothetical protein